MKFNSHGFTLIEMMVVVVIMAVLLSIATLQFESMQVKSSIDTQTRELLADLGAARMGAIQTKASRNVTLSGASAAFRSYSTTNDITGTLLFTKTFKNPINYNGYIGFTSIGFTTFSSNQTLLTQPRTIAVLSPEGTPGGTTAAIDCLVISMTKINVGKYNNGNCVFQ